MFGAAEEVVKAVHGIRTLRIIDEVKQELISLGITAEIIPYDYRKGFKICFHSDEDYNLFRLLGTTHNKYEDYIDNIGMAIGPK